MAPLAIYHHPLFAQHDTGQHPECIARYEAVTKALQNIAPDLVDWREARRAEREDLLRVHNFMLLRQLEDLAPGSGRVAVDGGDTLLSPQSLVAAEHAAGAVCQAVDDCLGGDISRAFCAVRPPGHHAEAARAMGFCLYNNVAVGAARALEKGVERVAIIDFDVHHGNGTQAIFYDVPEVFYGSVHQGGMFPGTGWREETGEFDNIRNLPLPAEVGSEVFRAAWQEYILPDLDKFQPKLLFISAGFDGHRRDPIGGWNLETEDFVWITDQLIQLANQHSHGRIISTLEGGYDLQALGEAVQAHVETLAKPCP